VSSRLKRMLLGATVLWVACSSAPRAEAGPYPFTLEFSGTDFVLLVDNDDDGPDADDCRYRILLDSNAAPPFFYNLRIEAIEDPGNSVKLNLCTGEYLGDLLLDSDDSSDYAELDFESTDMNTGGNAAADDTLLGLRYFPPMEIELFEEFGGPPDGFPMGVTDVVVTGSTEDEDDVLFLMRPCNEGGPALQITPTGGPGLLLPLELYPDDANPTHLKMSGLPFELASPDLGTTVTKDAYFPIDNRAMTAQVSGGGPVLFSQSIDGLSGCARTGAPTASQWTTAAILIGLLLVGCASLGRWRFFYRSLPRV